MGMGRSMDVWLFLVKEGRKERKRKIEEA